MTYIDGNVDLSIDRTEVDTYELSFELPLLILAVALFVFDVFIRKFKWTRKQDRVNNPTGAKQERKEQTNETVQ